MSNELKVAIEAAKAGAENALRYFNNQPAVTMKTDDSPVTIADKTTEEIIKNTIIKSFPDARFVGEESGGTIDSEDVWLIDPIDGTRNFIRSLPFWGIEIAFVNKGESMLGVSYGPSLNEMLYAEKGQGAYYNEERIFVSKINMLSDAFLNCGNITYFPENIDNIIKLISAVSSGRGYGDFYGYHLVAEGKADIMLDAHNKPWDIAAVKVIVEEAGGKVTNFQGKEWSFTDSLTVATNGLIHDEVIRILNQ